MRRVFGVHLGLLVLVIVLTGTVFLMFSPPDFDLTYQSEGTTFKGKIDATGLKSSSPYILCLNGKVGQDGNEALKKYGEYGGEGYYDFEEVKSDRDGRFTKEFEVKLAAGDYDVTFLVKDKKDGYKCVYDRNHVRFTITAKQK